MAYITSKLTINLSKTKYMLFANINTISLKDRKKFRINIGKYTIHEVLQIKYLGTIIDNNLNWGAHIEYLTSKLSQVAGMMYKIRKHLSMDSRLLVYNSLAASHLLYGILSWGSAPHTTLSRLQSLQDRIVRYMTFSPPDTDVDSKFKSLKILKIKELYHYEQGKFVHSTHHKYSPISFHNYFQEITYSQGTRTRENNNFRAPLPRTERGKRSLKYSCVEVWSNITDSLRQQPKSIFKTRFKKHILLNTS